MIRRLITGENNVRRIFGISTRKIKFFLFSLHLLFPLLISSAYYNSFFSGETIPTGNGKFVVVFAFPQSLRSGACLLHVKSAKTFTLVYFGLFFYFSFPLRIAYFDLESFFSLVRSAFLIINCRLFARQKVTVNARLRFSVFINKYLHKA